MCQNVKKYTKLKTENENLFLLKKRSFGPKCIELLIIQ